MDRRIPRESKRPGFNIGSASVIMVFAVLCLAIFSVLSLITTNSDLKLSRRAAKSIEDYFEAELLAEDRVIEINERLKGSGTPKELLVSLDGIKVEESENAAVIRFIQPVDTRRDLHVALRFDYYGKLLVTEWRLLPNDSDWNPDAGIGVWSGN